MIISKVEIENWKLFRDVVQFAFSPEVNLIVGPNEAGKSTLVEAISRGLYDKHTTRAAELTAVQPWGTSLSPRVTVEFVTKGEEYRIRKRFLSSQESVLSKKVGGKWQRIAEGDQADKQVSALLDTELYEHGASKPEHRGLTQLLWMPQGRFELPDDLNRTTHDKLRSVLGVMSVAPEEQEAAAEIDRRFAAVFTARRMDYAKSSRIQEVQADIKKTEEELSGIKQKVGHKEELVHRIEQMQVALRTLKEDLSKAEEDLVVKQEERDEARRHKEARIRAESELNRAKSAYEELDERVTAIAKTEGDIADAQKELKSTKWTENRLRKESEGLEKQVKEKQRLLAQLRQKESALATELRSLRIHYDLVRDQNDLQTARTRLTEAQEVLRKLRGIEAKLTELQAPSEEELEGLRQLASELDRKKAALDASSLRVCFQAATNVKGIVENSSKENFSLTSGEEREWTSPRRLSIELDGIGRFSAQGASQQAVDLEKQVSDLEQRLHTELAAFGAVRIEDAAKSSHQRRDLESLRDKLSNQVEQLIPDGEDALRKHVSRLDAKVKVAQEKAGRLSDDIVRKLGQLDLSAQQDMLAEAINRVEERQEVIAEKVEEAEEQVAKLQEDKQKKEKAIQNIRERSAGLKGQLRTLKNNLKKLRDDGLSQQERLEKRKELLKNYKEAQQFYEALEEEAEEKETRPEEAFRRAEKKVKDLQNKERAKTEQLRTYEGQLRSLAEEGLYERESELTERLSELQKQQIWLQTDAEAIKLLKLLKDHFQQRTLDSLVEPVRRIVEPSFRRLVGPRYDAIRLDRAMRPSTVTVAGWGQEADSSELSFGTREQLAFLVRLALGELLARDERVAVVLDDPLVNTDPARFGEALGIIQEASRKVQVFILTCHETAYTGLEANTVELGGY